MKKLWSRIVNMFRRVPDVPRAERILDVNFHKSIEVIAGASSFSKRGAGEFIEFKDGELATIIFRTGGIRVICKHEISSIKFDMMQDKDKNPKKGSKRV